MSEERQRIEREWIEAAAARDAHLIEVRKARRLGLPEEVAAAKACLIERKAHCKALMAEYRALLARKEACRHDVTASAHQTEATKLALAVQDIASQVPALIDKAEAAGLVAIARLLEQVCVEIEQVRSANRKVTAGRMPEAEGRSGSPSGHAGGE